VQDLPKGALMMESMHTNPETASSVPAFADGEARDQGISSNFLYQAATVLGMLLFLFSI
jgi:hypothetical protein